MNPNLSITPLEIALVAWLAISVIQFVGGRMIRRERDYYPSYKWLKQILGTLGVLAVLARFTGITGTLAYQVAFIGGLLLATLVEFRHIRRRNADPVYMTVKTRRGLVEIRSKDEARLLVSEACGVIRHDRLGKKKVLDPKAIAELREALGLPSETEWEAELRRQVMEHRERLAGDKIFAAEIDLFQRELRRDNPDE